MNSVYEVKTEIIRIPNGENTIYGTFCYPVTENKVPLVLMSHGYNGSEADFMAEAQTFATHGIAAYSLDFCGGSSRSKSTGSTTDMTIFTEKNDLLSVYHYFVQHSRIDANNIFLLGGSMGGLVTTLVAEELCDRIAGVTLYFPALCVADNWRENYPDPSQIPATTDFWGMTLGREFFTSIHDFYINEIIGHYPNRVLILHGDMDPVVPLSYSEQAVRLYRDAELIVLKGEGHGFQPEAGREARERVLKFIKDNIR